MSQMLNSVHLFIHSFINLNYTFIYEVKLLKDVSSMQKWSKLTNAVKLCCSIFHVLHCINNKTLTVKCYPWIFPVSFWGKKNIFMFNGCFISSTFSFCFSIFFLYNFLSCNNSNDNAKWYLICIIWMKKNTFQIFRLEKKNLRGHIHE